MNTINFQQLGTYKATEETTPELQVLPPVDSTDSSDLVLNISTNMHLIFNPELQYKCKMILIHNVSDFQITGLNLIGCIYIQNSAITLRNVQIKDSPEAYLLDVSENSNCQIIQSTFGPSKLFGIGIHGTPNEFYTRASKCRIQSCKIFGCKESLLSCSMFADVDVEDTTFTEGKSELICLIDFSIISLKKCIIEKSDYCGLFGFLSKIHISECIFRFHKIGCISLRDSFGNRIENTEMSDSDTSILLDNSSLSIYKSHITRSKGNGINAQIKSKVEVEDCIFENADWPLCAICDQSKGFVKNSIFKGSGMSGFIVRTDSSLEITGSTIKNCRISAVRISDSRSVTFDNCILSNSEFSLIDICDGGFGVFKNCVLLGQSNNAINVYTGGSISCSNLAMIGPFKHVGWFHHGGAGQLKDIIMSNVDKRIKKKDINDFVQHIKQNQSNDTKVPIIDTFDFAENKGKVTNNLFVVDTKWNVIVQNTFIDNFGKYELNANVNNMRDPNKKYPLIPGKCFKCGKVTQGLHFFTCGHSIYCKECLDSFGETPKTCDLCDLPVESVVKRFDFSETDNLCCCCYTNEVDSVILPCGHTICKECSSKWFLENNVCPFCRETSVQIRCFVTYE
ncbi:right-handed parallel beta-helix repeat-containing protein [Histomonas meleagridis]|uniref:right-handed parallel beta-helix repeat-containing protein n=1 Tax=Histomonas meleagridis TaxID=135588 RepID=UPI003559F727|nr:right-handed parallel beta-helix repeat-containing protein [Histomonas meleagridis]KAH0802759.1 right-handed parallel beta-helix repeat-containing protein [Histomonas meleagridis]